MKYDKCRAFLNVFVDCVVLGWLKPTKLCKMVKLMLQCAIMFFLDDADVKIVDWVHPSIFVFKIFAQVIEKLCMNLEFAAELNRENKLFGFEIMMHVHIDDLWLVWVDNFVVHDNCAIKYEFLTQILKYWQKHGHFLKFWLIVLYLADWNRTNFAKWSN